MNKIPPIKIYRVKALELFPWSYFGMIQCATEKDNVMDKNEFKVGDEVKLNDCSYQKWWKDGILTHWNLHQPYGKSFGAKSLTVLQSEGVKIFLETDPLGQNQYSDILLLGEDGDLVFGIKEFLEPVKKDFSYLVTKEEVAKVKNYQEALDVSIKHWKQLSELTKEEYEFIEKEYDMWHYIRSNRCGLCFLYKLDCIRCSLHDNGLGCCEEWYNVSDNVSDIVASFSVFSLPDFRKAATKMYEKLSGMKNG